MLSCFWFIGQHGKQVFSVGNVDSWISGFVTVWVQDPSLKVGFFTNTILKKASGFGGGGVSKVTQKIWILRDLERNFFCDLFLLTGQFKAEVCWLCLFCKIATCLMFGFSLVCPKCQLGFCDQKLDPCLRTNKIEILNKGTRLDT